MPSFLKYMLHVVMLLSVCLLLAVPAKATPVNVASILDKVTESYTESGFTADFVQTSTLNVMNITDTATGHLRVKKPDKMRWEYETPEPQTIITDGHTLWVHQPLDQQVMVGQAPAFFGDGKGAGFLTDLSQLRKHFDVRLAPEQSAGEYRLELIPHEKNSDVARVLMMINQETYRINALETQNEFGDITHLVFNNVQPVSELSEDWFKFNIPEGAAIIQLDE